MPISNTIITIKKALTTGNTPSSLANGELAINSVDGKLFYRKPDGTITFITNSSSFSTISANGTSVSATSPTDILTLTPGSGVTISACTSTKTITISGALDIAALANASSITPNGNVDQYEITALAVPGTTTINAPSGTPVDGQKLIIRIKDNGTAQTLSWITTTGGYKAVGVTLPTTTVANKYLYVGCIYNSQASFWDVIATAQE